MSCTVKELKDWANTLPENHRVAVDDGGLCLVAFTADQEFEEDADVSEFDDYLEIGGVPLKEDDTDHHATSGNPNHDAV